MVSGTLGFAGVRHPAHFGPHRSCIPLRWPRRGHLANADCLPRDYAAVQDFRAMFWRDNSPVESCKSCNPVENLPRRVPAQSKFCVTYVRIV